MNQQAELDLPERTDYVLRGNLATPEDVRRYVLGGRGMVTVQSAKTGAHRTYQLSREADGTLVVDVLTGPDRSARQSWTHVGALKPADGIASPLVRWRFETWEHPTGIYAQARWFFARVGHGSAERGQQVLDQADVFHEGVCGRCGRTLTHPDSIRTGLGPVCANKET